MVEFSFREMKDASSTIFTSIISNLETQSRSLQNLFEKQYVG